MKKYFNILHANYNFKITESLNNKLLNLLPIIKITLTDHNNNLKLLKIRKR